MLNKDFYQQFSLWVGANVRAWPGIITKKDWLRSIRKAQGMKGKELAEKLGVSAARVSMMEQDEAKGALTLNTLEKAAAALDCELAYLLIPKQSLQQGNVKGAASKPRVKILPQRSER